MNSLSWRRLVAASGLCALLSVVLVPATPRALLAGPFKWGRCNTCNSCNSCNSCDRGGCAMGEEPPNGEVGGNWYWLRSPEEEKRFVISTFNRYCIRCHGIDGRGVWDIPDVPNFANARWQASRSDGQLARAILEGRGAVMPPWRGVLSLDEAWAMARYVRTLVPGSEVSRPDFNAPEQKPPQKTAQRSTLPLPSEP